MGHWYNPNQSGEFAEHPVEGWLPSVSTILKATSFKQQRGLAKAALKKPFEFEQRKRLGAERGATIHTWINCYLNGYKLPKIEGKEAHCNTIKPYLDAVTTLSCNLISELPVFHSCFAGTIDLMVQDNVNYQRRLIDFKTKDAPIQPQALHEAALQLTGYAEAYEYQFGDRVQDLAVVVIYPTHYTTHHFNPNTHLEEWRNRRIGYSFAQSQSLMGRG